MQVSTSSYYNWLKQKPSKREMRRLILTKEIHQIYRVSKCRYGSPRITKELNIQGIKAFSSQTHETRTFKKHCEKEIQSNNRFITQISCGGKQAHAAV